MYEPYDHEIEREVQPEAYLDLLAQFAKQAEQGSDDDKRAKLDMLVSALFGDGYKCPFCGHSGPIWSYGDHWQGCELREWMMRWGVAEPGPGTRMRPTTEALRAHLKHSEEHDAGRARSESAHEERMRARRE